MSYECFVFSRFFSFQERSSLDKGQESSPMWLNEEVDRAKERVERVIASLRMQYGLGLVKVKDKLGVDSDEFESTPPLKMSLRGTCESAQDGPKSIHISPDIKFSVLLPHRVDSYSSESIL
ncbi:hypothetical protein PIB30_057332 [Stylosanthes scabra]|uniref:Uncharacterized protein n=1 Tax=Stylosanthes scabra TaxID=79078 RepID=A0ABU6SJJ6_9FABA|nr:hypothetical protein [Stylosanthes scabra]